MTEDGGGDNETRGQHFRRKYVGYTICLLFWGFFESLCCLPHVGHGGGTTTWCMVVTTNKGTRGQHRQRTYVGYTTCLLFFFLLLSLLYPTCWLWQRDNDEEDGGGDDGTCGQHRQRMYVGYTNCVFFLKNLFVVSHMLAMAEGQRGGGWW